STARSRRLLRVATGGAVPSMRGQHRSSGWRRSRQRFDTMTYIVQRKDRFYVVAYDGLDPLTGKERRRWHPVGHNRAEAETIAVRLEAERVTPPPAKGGSITLAEFLTNTWLPIKRRQVRATTA